MWPMKMESLAVSSCFDQPSLHHSSLHTEASHEGEWPTHAPRSSLPDERDANLN